MQVQIQTMISPDGSTTAFQTVMTITSTPHFDLFAAHIGVGSLCGACPSIFANLIMRWNQHQGRSQPQFDNRIGILSMMTAPGTRNFGRAMACKFGNVCNQHYDIGENRCMRRYREVTTGWDLLAMQSQALIHCPEVVATRDGISESNHPED